MTEKLMGAGDMAGINTGEGSSSGKDRGAWRRLVHDATNPQIEDG